MRRAELPSFVRIGGTRAERRQRRAAGRRLRSARRCNNPEPPAGEHAARHRARTLRPPAANCLTRLEADFGAVEGADVVADHRKLVAKRQAK